MVLPVINPTSPNITQVMLVINPTSPTKTSMEFKATTTTLKDFPNNNPIEWENFLGIQLNPIELREGEKEGVFRSYS
jgi:hypothetical protein